MLDQNESPYRLAYKNSVTVEMPKYMVRNPNTLMRNDNHQLGLSKDVDFKKEIKEKKPGKTI